MEDKIDLQRRRGKKESCKDKLIFLLRCGAPILWVGAFSYNPDENVNWKNIWLSDSKIGHTLWPNKSITQKQSSVYIQSPPQELQLREHRTTGLAFSLLKWDLSCYLNEWVNNCLIDWFRLEVHYFIIFHWIKNVQVMLRYFIRHWEIALFTFKISW